MIPPCDSESCHLHSHFPWHGAGAGSPGWQHPLSFCPHCSLLSGPLALPLPRPHSVLMLVLTLQRPPPQAGAVCLRGCHRRYLTQAFLHQANTGPPSPGHRPSPTEPSVALFMRGRLGQAPQASRGR